MVEEVNPNILDNRSEESTLSREHLQYMNTALSHPYIQIALQMAKTDPDIQNIRTHVHRDYLQYHDTDQDGTPDPTAGVIGTIVSSLRDPEGRKMMMHAFDKAAEDESERLKDEQVIEADVFMLGNGVQALVASAELRREQPNIRIVTIGEGTVFDISQNPAWQLNTGANTPHDESFEYKRHPDMNYLPGALIQARDISSRLYPDNTVIGDVVKMNMHMLAENMYRAIPKGPLRKNKDPNAEFKYEWTVQDPSTGRETTVRFKRFPIAAGFGKSETKLSEDEDTGQIIDRELAKTDRYLRFLKGEYKPSKGEPLPEPGRVYRAIEDVYTLFGIREDDSPHELRHKNVAVIGAGGHTGLTMLMGLGEVNTNSAGTSYPSSNGRVLAYGMPYETQQEFRRGRYIAETDTYEPELPVYGPVAELLPVNAGERNAFVEPIQERVKYIKEKGRKLLVGSEVDGGVVWREVDAVILSIGMKDSLSLDELFAEIPGYSEGEIMFAPMEGNCAQKLSGEEIYLLGATASKVNPNPVTESERREMPGFSVGYASPVMARTVYKTEQACSLICADIDTSGLCRIPREKIGIETEQIVGKKGEEFEIIIEPNPTPLTAKVSELLLTQQMAEVFIHYEFDDLDELHLEVSKDHEGNFVANIQNLERNEETENMLNRLVTNNMIAAAIDTRIAASTHMENGRPKRTAVVKIPILDNDAVVEDARITSRRNKPLINSARPPKDR